MPQILDDFAQYVHLGCLDLVRISPGSEVTGHATGRLAAVSVACTRRGLLLQRACSLCVWGLRCNRISVGCAGESPRCLPRRRPRSRATRAAAAPSPACRNARARPTRPARSSARPMIFIAKEYRRSRNARPAPPVARALRDDARARERANDPTRPVPKAPGRRGRAHHTLYIRIRRVRRVLRPVVDPPLAPVFEPCLLAYRGPPSIHPDRNSR